LITADRSPHVRAAAREENIAVLNKPVKPASPARAARPVAHPTDGRGGVDAADAFDARHQFMVVPDQPDHSGSSKDLAVVTAPGRNISSWLSLSEFQSSQCPRRRQTERPSGILKCKRQFRRGAHRAQALEIRHRVRLPMRKLIANE